MNQDIMKNLGLAIWALLSGICLWQLPKDGYASGFLAGIFLAISAFVVTLIGYLGFKTRKATA